MIRAAFICTLLGFSASADSAPHGAMDAFNAVCFKAGQTAAQARARMEVLVGSPLPFELTFWDVTLEPAAEILAVVERRCEVAFQGNHTELAISKVRAQMATPPVFGFAIDLPPTHQALVGTALIEARELLRDRVAIVHIGTRDDQTFMAVDRLSADWEGR